MEFKEAVGLLDKYNGLRGRENDELYHLFEHGMNVERYSKNICDELNLDPITKKDILFAAKYHDIGKLMFPPEMNDLTRKFTEEEFTDFKKHAKYSYEILEALDLGSIADLIRYHHEKIDGSGYPDRLRGDAIPLGSRIIAVCDAYDAMLSREYGKKTKEQAIQELKDGKGKHFDEMVVDAFLKTLNVQE